MKSRALALAVLVWNGAAFAAPPDAPQPVHPRATVIIEPPRIGVGQIAQIDVVAVTPPGHRLHPIAPPTTLDGLWVLDAVAEPVQHEALRWTHRTRIRVRGHEAGAVVWPALDLALEGPEGERWTLRTEARTLDVASVLEDFPDRVTPFSYRLPEVEPAIPTWAAAAGGALATLAAVLLIAVVRQRRGRAIEATAPVGAPWTAALDELAGAAVETEADWRGASDRAARSLRRYVGRRFGVPLESRTTEELEARMPPFVLASRWPHLLALLRALDADRFRAAGDVQATDPLRATLAEARRWVEDSIPPEVER